MKQLLFIATLVLFLVAPVYVGAQNTFGTTPTPTTSFNAPAVKSWFSKTYAKTEVFRKKQSVYFVTMRDELKKKLNIEQPPKETTTDIGISGIEEEPMKPYIKLDDPLDYGKYVFAISMSTMFSNPMIFYVSSLLLAFIVLKFVIRMVV